MVMQERIQKILSQRGICSRRKAEEYITAGLVKVNGKTAELGQKADPEVDQIEVDGKVIEERKEMLYFLMNKPEGIETSNVARFSLDSKKQKPKNDKTNYQSIVRDLLPPNLQGKIYPVGRLDKDSCGLLLFTNDGVLAYRLTHPKFDHEKEYEVTTAESITDGQLRKLEQGITISGSKTKKAAVQRLSGNKFKIALTEGRNRQIRRMVQKVGGKVKKLERVRIMTLKDNKLKPEAIRPLSALEKQELLSSVGLKK